MRAGGEKGLEVARKQRTSEEDEDAENRTTAVGLFNHAHSYWRGAVALQSAHVEDATHPDDPVLFLYCHAVELFLKAFLRAKGMTAKVLRGEYGHKIIEIANEAKNQGLVIDDRNACLIGLIDAMDTLTLRYIRIGAIKRVDLNDLDGLCRYLHCVGFQILKSQGCPMRKYLDQKPT